MNACILTVACYAGHSRTLPGLQALVESFRARQPELVQQVESLMTELEHMSVVWTEQWHIALLELQVRALTSCIPATGLASPSKPLQWLDTVLASLSRFLQYPEARVPAKSA